MMGKALSRRVGRQHRKMNELLTTKQIVEIYEAASAEGTFERLPVAIQRRLVWLEQRSSPSVKTSKEEGPYRPGNPGNTP